METSHYITSDASSRGENGAITDYSLLGKAPSGTYIHQTALPALLNPHGSNATNNNNAPMQTMANNNDTPPPQHDEDTRGRPQLHIPEALIPEPIEEEPPEPLEQEEEEDESSHDKGEGRDRDSFVLNSAGYVQTPSPSVGSKPPSFPQRNSNPSGATIHNFTDNYVPQALAPTVS